jgi:hypothetical protein
MNRPAVLAVTLPGATELRLEAEAEVRRREWPVVAAPAAADLLLVCGVPAPEDAEWLDGIERSMPEPALRIVARESGQVADALDMARRDLIDRAVTRHRADAADGPGAHEHGDHEGHGDGHGHGTHHDSPPPEASDDQGDRGPDHHRVEHGHGDHAAHSDHEGHDHHQPADHAAHMGHMDHQGHGGHMDHLSHDMHAMGEVAGLPMAERGDDRDELRLDQLHVPIGPALSDWPAGLVLRLTLQGDVVQDVEVDHLPVPSGHRLPFWDEPWLRAARGEEVSRGSAARRRCAAHLDSAGLTNLGAFAVCALPGAHTIDDYRGLARAHPALLASLVVCLLGLVGTPPTAVFLGKLEAFSAAFDGGYAWLAVVAAVNTVASLFYYLRWIAPAFLVRGPVGDPGAMSGPAAVVAHGAATGSVVLGVLGGTVLDVLGGPLAR